MIRLLAGPNGTWGCEIMHDGNFYRAAGRTKKQAQELAEMFRDSKTYCGIRAYDA